MRYTLKNPNGGGYRIWMTKAGEFRLVSQHGDVFAFGDLVDKLGKLEDEEEKAKHKK